jgi:hypothetical protein
MMRRREFIAALAAAWPIAAEAQQSATPEIRTHHAGSREPLAVPYGAGLKNSITALAARNNAIWCDTVCRAQDRPGEFHETLWFTRLGAPRFYPDVVTLAGVEAASVQLEAIAGLIASNREKEWFVKDSFQSLQLNSLGFKPLFDAEWIAMNGAPPGLKDNPPEYRSTVVTGEAGLIAWEQSWAGEKANSPADPSRVFKTRLLDDTNVVFVSIQGEGGSIAGGGILNRGAQVIGLSNLFGSKLDLVWQRLTAMAGEIFPGLPLVGYEQGHQLEAAKLAGFESIGPLRVWRRRAATP